MKISEVRELLDYLENTGRDLDIRLVLANNEDLVEGLRQADFLAIIEATAWQSMEVVVSEKMNHT